jgi:hypothetical protein
MSTFNGDLLLVERGSQGGVYLLMGDFTGHGLTAAMGTLPVAMIFFKMARNSAYIGEIARELNRQLNKLMPVNLFFSATLIELNARSDIMSVWMGGMPECYWFNKQGDLKGVIHSKHMPLGILEDSEFRVETEVYNVNKLDKVYLYSDGVTEANSPNNTMFGNERLKEILISHGDERFEQVLSELKNFTGDNNQNDDITLVEMTCLDVPAANNKKESHTECQFSLPWHISTTISINEIRDQDPVSLLSDLLSSLPVLAKHKGVLHVLLSEMYSNALDYSILDLAHFTRKNEEQFIAFYREREVQLHLLEGASINFDFTFIPDTRQPSLQIRIKDSGKGYKEPELMSQDDKPHGRGLEIINSFCEKVSFYDNGRVLEVVYRL